MFENLGPSKPILLIGRAEIFGLVNVGPGFPSRPPKIGARISYFSQFYLLVHLAYLPYMQMRGPLRPRRTPGVPPAHPRASISWRMPTS